MRDLYGDAGFARIRDAGVFVAGAEAWEDIVPWPCAGPVWAVLCSATTTG